MVDHTERNRLFNPTALLQWMAQNALTLYNDTFTEHTFTDTPSTPPHLPACRGPAAHVS